MKKFITFLFVLILACTMVYAVDHSINLGFEFHFGSGNAAKPTKSFSDRYLKNNSIDLHLGYNLELNNGLVVYDNVGVGYVTDLEAKGTDSVWLEGNVWVKSDLTSLFVQEDIGVGYAFHFNNIRLITAGGFHCESIITEDVAGTNKGCNFDAYGLNLLIQGDCSFSEHFSFFGAIKPNLNFYSSWKNTETDCSSSAIGFSGSAVAGASFKF